MGRKKKSRAATNVNHPISGNIQTSIQHAEQSATVVVGVNQQAESNQTSAVGIQAPTSSKPQHRGHGRGSPTCSPGEGSKGRGRPVGRGCAPTPMGQIHISPHQESFQTLNSSPSTQHGGQSPISEIIPTIHAENFTASSQPTSQQRSTPYIGEVIQQFPQLQVQDQHNQGIAPVLQQQHQMQAHLQLQQSPLIQIQYHTNASQQQDCAFLQQTQLAQAQQIQYQTNASQQQDCAFLQQTQMAQAQQIQYAQAQQMQYAQAQQLQYQAGTPQQMQLSPPQYIQYREVGASPQEQYQVVNSPPIPTQYIQYPQQQQQIVQVPYQLDRIPDIVQQAPYQVAPVPPIQQLSPAQYLTVTPQQVQDQVPTPLKQDKAQPILIEVAIRPVQEELPKKQHTSKPNAQVEAEEVPANFRRGGTQGRTIKVLANHFPLRLSPKMTKVYQYDVTIEPDRPRKLLPLVMQQMQRNYYPNNNPAYDGMKNLISALELPLALPFTGVVKIVEDERDKEYHVKIQLVSTVDMTALARFFNQKAENQMVPPMHVLQCLDIVLRSRPSTSLITAGRSYFSIPEEIVTLGNGMEMYRGFYQSAILGWKPFLNVDVSHKAFPSRMCILDLIKDIDKKADLNKDISRFAENKLAKLVYNLKVEYILPGKPLSKRTYRVNGLEQSASRYSFKNDNNRELTVAEYFHEEKKYKLKYPHLPCLWVGNKQKKPRMVVPCELCTVIAGQVTNQKMDDMQTRNMIRNATCSTNDRKAHIMRSMQLANHNDSPVMQEFGLRLDCSMTEVTGRVLQAPSIKHQHKTQNVVKGVWRSGVFINSVPIQKWCILCLDDKINDRHIFNMKELFVRQGKQWGMQITTTAKSTRLRLNRNSGFRDICDSLERSKKENMQLVVVVLLDTNKECYGWVKKAAELQTGCLTQCMKGFTINGLSMNAIDNILLKVNAKLNGINHVLGERPFLLNRPTMIMGADVTHPSPESRENSPSVAAVTASQDPQAVRYNIMWRLQDPRAEIITDLERMTKDQLMIFYRKTNLKPERIIFYRDGVSDGQFAAVRQMEIQAVRNACISLNQDYKPAITFLVVQKRHHTRLFPCDPRDSEDKNGNVPAGTCVDTQITHPTAQDFYLVSHASIQGVAKPTKYRTLWDDSNVSDNDIEQLTYYLCHLFVRCNQSVSYPAPTYYAHLAAARAKVYIEDNRLDLSDLKKLQEKINIVDDIQKNHPMFFV